MRLHRDLKIAASGLTRFVNVTVQIDDAICDVRLNALAFADFRARYLIAYNLACYECQLGNLKEAMEFLGAAIDLAGKKDIRTRALDDPDLEPLWAKISEI